MLNCWCITYPAAFGRLIKLEFSRQIFRKISNSMKICPVGAELLHVDGRTDGQDEVSRFSRFFEGSWKRLIICRRTVCKLLLWQEVTCYVSPLRFLGGHIWNVAANLRDLLQGSSTSTQRNQDTPGRRPNVMSSDYLSVRKLKGSDLRTKADYSDIGYSAGSSETSIYMSQCTRRHTPEN